MACNCATNEQLSELYKRFGEKKADADKKTKFKIKNLLIKAGVGLCIMLMFPFLVIYVFYKIYGTDDHKISVKKFFRLEKRA